MDIRPLYSSTVTRQLHNDDTVIVGLGVKTLVGNLTITPAGSSVVLAANKDLILSTGTGSVDFSSGSGSFKTTTGPITLGPGAVTVSGTTTITSAGTALAVTNNVVVNGSTTANGVLYAHSGVERSSAGTLTIGTGANTSAITIGRSGQLTTLAGNVSISGTETVVGATTFTANAAFEGDVVFGNAITDTVEFLYSRIKNSLPFLKDQAHQIQVDKSSDDLSGGALSLLSGSGGDGVAAPGGVGGTLTLTGGSGGAGTGVLLAGAGASVTVRSGSGGSDGGAGGASSGNLTLDVGTPSGSALPGMVLVGATAQGVTLGQSGKTTTVTGSLSQSSGSVSLTGNAASQLSTSSGTLTLSGFAGINLQGNGTSALQINGAGTQVTVPAGSVLTTTSTGNINLPNNGSARFQIEGSGVGSTVTSTALNIVTNGSNADAYHTHTGLGSPPLYSATAGENLFAGQPAAQQLNTGSKAMRASAAPASGVLANVTGFVIADTASGNTASIQLSGEISIPDARWDSVPSSSDIGKRVYLSETSGKTTTTAPTTSGSTTLKVGILKDGGTGNCKVIIQVGEGVQNS